MSNLQKLGLSFGIKIKNSNFTVGGLLLKAFMMEFQIS